uniref:FCH and double SH3 domains 1 n=1 Tax=Malurus cyaneus samueli TaxID=2593467 RepID=A0A8C5X6W7_9PASS
MQPPPRKVKLTQELRVHLLEQLSGLQSKQQRDAELLEDIRMQLWVGCPQMQGPAGTGGLAVLLGAKGQGVPSPCEPCAHRTAAAVWRGVIEGTAHAGQVRVTASESYRALAAEAARSARLSKERTLKKGIERLQKAQVELLETVKELDKAKKQFSHLQRSSEVAKDKAADVEARLRKSDRRIFHTKASLQKLSAKVSGVLAEHSRQLAGVQNEYSFALVSATAHLEHYQRVELPAAMQVGAARTPRAPLPGSHKDHAPPAGTGGLKEGLFQPLTGCHHPLSCGCLPRCCSGWRPGGSRGRRQKQRPWSGRWRKRGKLSGRQRWVPSQGIGGV